VTQTTRRAKGTGQITWSESRQRWRVRIDHPGTGKPVTRFVKGTRTQAEGALHDLQVQLLSPSASDNITMEEFLALWLNERRPLIGKNLPAANFNSYERAVNNIILHIPKMKLRDLRPVHVKQMLQALADSGQGRSTVTQTKTNLQKMLRYAVENGFMDSNPAQMVSMADDIDARSSEPGEAMTQEQVDALRSAIVGDWMEPMILIGLSRGFRPGELLGLQWRYLDYRTGVYQVRRSLHRIPRHQLPDGTVIPEHVELGPLKGDKRHRDPRASRPRSERNLGLDPALIDLFRRQEKMQKEAQLLAGPDWQGNPDGLIFTSEVGTALTPRNTQRHFDILTERAGIGHWDLYSLRHTCASHMRDQGFTAAQVADLLGNTERVVLTSYFHSVQEIVTAHSGLAATHFSSS
jgi:integrase